MSGTPPDHLSTLTLHRLRYGELDGPALSSARAHLADCATCAGRLQVQERERAAFVATPVPDAIRALGARTRPRSWWADLVPFAVALAAAALLFVLVPPLREATDGPGPDTIRFRGELPTVEVWVDRGRGARPFHQGESVRAGDRVQLQYDPHGASVVVIAGRDGTGEIEVYSANAPTGIGLVRMPFSLVLDDAPGPQELFVIGADAPLGAAEVKAAIARGVPGVRVARVVLPKER